MLALLFSLLLFIGAGVAFGLFFAGTDDDFFFAAFIGTWLGLIAWLIWFRHQHQGLLSWLRLSANELDDGPHGMWREFKERVIKIQREHFNSLVHAEAKINQFFEAIQASPNGVIFLDEENRIEWLNWTASDQLGLDLVKDRDQIIINILRDPAFLKLINSSVKGPVVIQARNDLVQSHRRLALSVFPYGIGKKLLLSTDITQIEMAEAMRQQFVANVSHEIKTPLTVILGLIETLKTLQLREEERTRMLGMLEDHSNRMHSLVVDLLTLSKIEGTPPPNPQDQFDLRLMLNEAIDVATVFSKGLFGGLSHQFDLGWEIPERDISFRGDRSEMISAVTNLMTNAIRYSPSGSEIVIAIFYTDDHRLGIAVKDHGIGISSQHLPRLTERFYRVDSSRSRSTGGTGLGLAIVKHVLQRHEGTLEIQSQPGSGSTFTLFFPLERVIHGSNQ